MKSKNSARCFVGVRGSNGRSEVDWNFETLNPTQRHKLLSGLVVPRPIALVTTLGREGVLNAAPFSFFNVLGEDPPALVISIGHREGSGVPAGEQGGSLKDTARNIVETGEFVVHLVDEAITERMHGCSLRFPPEVSEVERVGFTTAPSRMVRPPRIVEAPVAMECTLLSRVPLGNHDLYIGRIAWLHVREGLVDPATLKVRIEDYSVVGRLSGSGYVRIRDRFAIDVNAYAPQT
jgi:flavin reductase (DIM6/NTAB) family NADH-FMN oxidoreductase RutF